MSQNFLCLGPVVPLLWDQIFLRLLLKNFMTQYLFKVLLECISLENDINTARAKIIDCNLTFYLRICEFQDFFDRYRDFFWDQTFLRQFWDFFETKIFWDRYWDFFETKFVETDTALILSKNEKSLETKKSRDKMSHSVLERKSFRQGKTIWLDLGFR